MDGPNPFQIATAVKFIPDPVEPPRYGTSGIYAIMHRSSRRLYVGSARDIRIRWCGHLGDLRDHRHANPFLQTAWDKHGETEFTWHILEECEDALLILLEQKWMDHYRAYERAFGFNSLAQSQRPKSRKMNDQSTEFRKIILAALKSSGHSRYWLATEMSKAQASAADTIYAYLRGRRDSTGKTLAAIFDILELTIVGKSPASISGEALLYPGATSA